MSQHPGPRTAAAGSPRPQPQPGWARSATPEARGSRAVEGAPAPPAGLGAAAADPGRLRRSSGPAPGRAPRVLRPPIRTPSPLAPPLPAAPASPRPCQPQRLRGVREPAGCSGARREGPLRGPGKPGRAAPGVSAPRRLRGRLRAARASSRQGGRRQLTRSAPESASSSRSTPEPAGIFPGAPRPGARPVPGARSPRLVAAARIAPLRSRRRRRLRSSGPRAASPAAPPRSPPGSGSEAKSAGARSLGPVRPPASQPPAPLFCALETAGEAARPPRRGPARRPAPALAGLTRALKAPRPPRRAAPRLAARTVRRGTGRDSGARVRRRCRRHSLKVCVGRGGGGQEKARGFPPPKPGHPSALVQAPAWAHAGSGRSVLSFVSGGSSPAPQTLWAAHPRWARQELALKDWPVRKGQRGDRGRTEALSQPAGCADLPAQGEPHVGPGSRTWEEAGSCSCMETPLGLRSQGIN